jgi:hypothetical protein
MCAHDAEGVFTDDFVKLESDKAIFANLLYGGPLSPLSIGLLSTAISLALSLDYLTNYHSA